jgi:Cd2+/Zn2+-exporting ATPase
MKAESATPADTIEAASAPVNRTRLIAAGVAALASEAVELAYGDTWVALVLSLAAIGVGGLSTYKKGWIAFKNRNLNMNALMTIAVTGALLIGHWPEAAMVMVLFTLAEVLEARSLDRARSAIRGLMALTPDKATMRQPDGSWIDVEAGMIPVGSLVRLKPGERIALDGELVEGHSAVNQSPITGESLPVEKAVGDTVFAGTINEYGSFVYRVTAGANDSTLARIIHAVEQAQSSRAPTQRFVDQFARYYTPAVFALALAVAVAPPLLAGGQWMDWIYRALVLLVIACPCALVISTPVSIVSGLAAAARKGILIKGGAYLEDGHKLRWLAFDKTGTLTHGKPVQTDFEAWQGADASHVRTVAASLAARSDHPVSRALAVLAREDGVPLLEVTDFAAIPGRGIQGRIGSQFYCLANSRRIEELHIGSPELRERFSALESQGKSAVALTDEKRVFAVFAVADTIKESSRQAVSELHALGVQTVMLSGDNAHTAKAIAAKVGTDRVLGDLLPEDKLREIERLLSPEGKVGMAGDGINDAPALARADIGFAMGAAGADTAIETADVALMDDDLRKIPAFIRLSRATTSVLKQNILFALGIKAAFLALAFMGQATMWMAVFADMGTSLLVVFNGLRLLRK